MLIDALSQWRTGALEANKGRFKQFVRDHIPGGSKKLPEGISHYRSDTKVDPLCDCADVLYHGFRCGVLHEAHAKPYCMVEARGGEKVFYIEKKGLTWYGYGGDCVSVIIDPFELLDEVSRAFDAYTNELLDSSSTHDPKLREDFEKKFLWAFGIDVR